MTYQKARAAADKADSDHKAACDAIRATEAAIMLHPAAQGSSRLI